MLKYTLFCAFCMLSTLGFAQQTINAVDSLEQDLEEIVVTATGANRYLSTLPLSTLMIKEDEINNTNTLRLTDILGEQVALNIVGDFGGGNGLQLQGLDAEHTLIMIDGKPLIGRSAGTLDLDRITLGNVKQIEVIKGASSSLYGSEALGGVVNIITKKPEEGFKANANYRFGSLDSHDGNVSVNYKKGKLGIAAFANRYSSEGYNLGDAGAPATVTPFSNYSYGLNSTVDLSKKTELLLGGRFFTQNQDLPVITSEEKSETDDWNLNAELKRQINDEVNISAKTYYTNYKASQNTQQHIINPFLSNFYNQQLFMPEVKGEWKASENQVVSAGLGWRYDKLDRSSFAGVPEFNAQFAYAQLDKTIGQLNVVTGLRFDNHSEYASQLSPKMAGRYEFSNTIAIKASAGQGFKTPDFRQLYFDFSNTMFGYSILGVNVAAQRLQDLENAGQIARYAVAKETIGAELKPESAWNFNASIQLTPTNSFQSEIGVFRNSIKNLIENNVLAFQTNGAFLFGYENVNEAFTQGLDINNSFKANDQWKVAAGYQLLFAKDKALADEHDDYFGLNNRSKHTANLKVTYQIPAIGFNTNVRTTYRSKFGIEDSNTNGYLDQNDVFASDYFLINWAANKTFKEQYGVSLGVENLLDYTDTQNLSHLPGRKIYGGINFSFK